jgi:transposase InsO family protein
MSKLTTDVTYIPCSDRKFIYLSPLFDLFNHEIASYSISTVNSEDFVSGMLAALPPEALKDALVHNDQGAVYWSNGWVKLCEELQVVRSMSRRGNCWDNALSEHFFSAMKVELGLTKRGYKTLLQAKEVKELVNDYIPWYNTGRIQKKLCTMPRK